MEFTPVESSTGGTLLSIANRLSYKSCNDLNIYKKSELESAIIEVINPQKSNIIIGSIYKHPSMDLDDFNKNVLNKLLDKVSKEQKSVYLLGDFNVNLLNYNDHPPTNEFLDSLASNSVIPYILQPTRITDHSETLIDNIFSNVITVDAISGNLTVRIFDQLPQIMILQMHLLILPQTDPISMKETGQTLIKLIFYLTTFLLTGMIHSKSMKKT